MAEDVGRAIKGKTCNDTEGLGGKLDRCSVAVDDLDVRPSTAKSVCPPRIELDGEDAVGCARELRGQPAAACAEIEHELVRPHAGFAHEIRGKSLRAEEVLATRAARPTRTSRASLGHEPSPSSSSAQDDDTRRQTELPASARATPRMYGAEVIVSIDEE